jgi:L-cysteine/cystine lyase
VTLAALRAAFPVLAHTAYLNAGTFGPLARPTVEAMQQQELLELEQGRSGLDRFERFLALRDGVRERLAALVGAEPAQVALTSSTTDACNIVLAGLDLAAEDEVVTTDAEHFGLLGPLHASRARVVTAPPDPERILAAVTPRTRLLALSQVTWTAGTVLPVRELRERSGLPVLADGAQSVGAVPVRARGLDFLTISCQKWLCGPDQTGALVVADPERLRVARPSFLSKVTHQPDGRFVPQPDARRFEPGGPASAALAGLIAALELAPARRFELAAAAAARCRQLLDAQVEVVPGEATLVSFRAPDGEAPERTVERLAAAGVVVRDIPGLELVRASCGWWTSEGDLERLAAALADR